MKPLHIGLLVAAGFLAGGVAVKLTQRPPAAAPPAVSAQAPAPVAPAAEPVQPATDPMPSPVPENKEPAKHRVTPRQARPAETTVAQSQTPAAVTAPEPAKEASPAAPPAEPPASAEPPAPAQPEPVAPAPPPPPQTATLAAGTLIPVRLVEGLSSDRNQAGDEFTATLDAPLVADGFVIAEKGARLTGRVVESQKAGRVKGVASIRIELTRLNTSDGQHVAIQTEPFEKQGPKSVGEDAAKIGAAAGIGAAIGAIAGGGKGAAIGAAAGGAAGTGDVLITRGKPAVLSTETKINFRLHEAVTLTERQGS